MNVLGVHHARESQFDRADSGGTGAGGRGGKGGKGGKGGRGGRGRSPNPGLGDIATSDPLDAFLRDVELFSQDEWKDSPHLVEIIRHAPIFDQKVGTDGVRNITVEEDFETRYRRTNDNDTRDTYRIAIKNEIQALKDRQQDHGREAKLDNIIGEATSFGYRFEEFCGFDAHTHPTTYRVLQTMILIGWHVAIHFKCQFNRTRPSFLCPDIVPLIEVPTHPSYPSGHATQAYLAALALREVFDYRIRALEWDEFHLGLLNLAMEIGENREWAGVHYASDTAAGQTLARDLWQYVRNNRGVFPQIDHLIQTARREWYENTRRDRDAAR